MYAQWVAEDPRFLHADSQDSDQTGRMPRLIWVFAGRTAILLVLSCRSSFVEINHVLSFTHDLGCLFILQCIFTFWSYPLYTLSVLWNIGNHCFWRPLWPRGINLPALSVSWEYGNRVVQLLHWLRSEKSQAWKLLLLHGHDIKELISIEPHHKKICFLKFVTSKTQTSLLSCKS